MKIDGIHCQKPIGAFYVFPDVSGTGLDGATFAWLFVLVLSAAIAFPVWGYRRRSFRLYGHSGCRPVAREES